MLESTPAMPYGGSIHDILKVSLKAFVKTFKLGWRAV